MAPDTLWSPSTHNPFANPRSPCFTSSLYPSLPQKPFCRSNSIFYITFNSLQAYNIHITHKIEIHMTVFPVYRGQSLYNWTYNLITIKIKISRAFNYTTWYSSKLEKIDNFETLRKLLVPTILLSQHIGTENYRYRRCNKSFVKLIL